MSPLTVPDFITSTFTAGVALAGVISDANAAPDSGQGQKGAGAGAGAGGGQGQQGAGGACGAGGKKGIDKVLEVDEDSDRPAWAGRNTAENPHSAGGGDGLSGGTNIYRKQGDGWRLITHLNAPTPPQERGG